MVSVPVLRSRWRVLQATRGIETSANHSGQPVETMGIKTLSRASEVKFLEDWTGGR